MVVEGRKWDYSELEYVETCSSEWRRVGMEGNDENFSRVGVKESIEEDLGVSASG